MMRILALLVCLPVAFAPPVEKQKTKSPATSENEQKFGLAYEHYLNQVVKELERDDGFVKRVQGQNHTEKQTIAENLEYVSHHIRSKLDELKRQEIDRLTKLQRLIHRKKMLEEDHPMGMPDSDEDDNDQDAGQHRPPFIPPAPADDVFRVDMDHVDHRNPYTFEKEDLERLMKKAAEDIQRNDEDRREEFKRYEMRKEHERLAHLKALDEAKRREEEAEFEKARQAARKHEKVHYPGRKEQLEDVWEDVDGLPEDQFNPRTFFFLHDTNGDGVLDPVEVEQLMVAELDKVYNNETNVTLDDNERYEEMNRMREEVFNNVDKNKDELITLDEFMAYTRTKEFSEEDDEEWKTIEDEQQFDDKEFQDFEHEYYDFDPPVDHPDEHPAGVDTKAPSPSQAPPAGANAKADPKPNQL